MKFCKDCDYYNPRDYPWKPNVTCTHPDAPKEPIEGLQKYNIEDTREIWCGEHDAQFFKEKCPKCIELKNDRLKRDLEWRNKLDALKNKNKELKNDLHFYQERCRELKEILEKKWWKKYV